MPEFEKQPISPIPESQGEKIEKPIGNFRDEIGSTIDKPKLPECTKKFAEMMESKLEMLLGVLTEGKEKDFISEKLDTVYGIMRSRKFDSDDRNTLEGAYEEFQEMLKTVQENNNIIDQTHVPTEYEQDPMGFVNELTAYIRKMHDEFEKEVSQPE